MDLLFLLFISLFFQKVHRGHLRGFRQLLYSQLQ
jgi:hypothetical protein